MSGASRGDWVVTTIGVFKLIKAALLGPLGVAVLLGLPEALVRTVMHSVGWTGVLLGHHLVRRAIARLLSIDAQAQREIGAACLIYAAVFVVEGVGLLRRRRWAEWLTVIVTASFIPFEIYELVRGPGAGKLIAIVLNLAIVVYLLWVRVRAHVPRASRLRAA
jgi:uncharacterized membrane protein (DUF2068 family)